RDHLMQVGYHADAITCMMFLTSMAGNPLCVGLAASAAGVEITWTSWALAAIVPGLISLAVMPLLMLRLAPPELKQIPGARELADAELAKMGPMSRAEKILAVVFVACLVLWATGSITKLGATPIAMMAVAIMIVGQVLTWKDILSEKGAWDAMFWMGGLVALATALAKSGFIKWIAAIIATSVSSANLGWVASFIIITVIYTYCHYVFASVTARISAIYAAFVAVAVACGAPALMVALVFGFMANCPISLTHYGNGCAPVYFGAGYLSQNEWWKNGLVVCTVNFAIWMTIGMAWWKLIGLW
ncbi:MAG: DASS family sodium-coupled anion symporter, partial [Duodenibacillus sp.]|nr:DASS family sodium-coupled anion symporter [Duodenibacillus sp.]